MNLVILVGVAAADGELRTTQSGKSIGKCRVKTTETYEGKSYETYHNVQLWGDKHAQRLADAKEGQGIEVTGRIKSETFDDKNGVKQYRTVIEASNVNLLPLPRTASQKVNGRSAKADAEADLIPF